MNEFSPTRPFQLLFVGVTVVFWYFCLLDNLRGCLYVCVCVSVYLCVCVCVSVRAYVYV